MSKHASVAPEERINITYRPATGDAIEEVELPLKILVIGDFTGRSDLRPLEDRRPIDIRRSNFGEVMDKHQLHLDLVVPNHLSGSPEKNIEIDLSLQSLKDFSPQAIADQVPQLRALLELRKALSALKGPIGNLPMFRNRLRSLLSSDAERDRLRAELILEAPKAHSTSSPTE